MQTSASRIVIAALLGATILSAPAHAGWFDFGSSKDDAKSARSGAKVEDKTSNAPKPSETLDGSIMQAKMLRLAGNYPEAIKHLSQLMIVASDDARVVSEYGKTLAAMGRAQESVSFLTRAQQLQPGDWTVYSALGVAYDQIGKQAEAERAYEQALVLKPGEPSVLNNYALSRMLAKDPEGAKKLMARAEIAGGASDAKIARNIAMVRKLAPDAADKDFAVNTPAPSPVPHVAKASLPAPVAVARQQAPVAAPRQLQPAPMIQAAPQMAQAQPSGVVMQRVPVDPLAGPVESKITVAQAPRAPKVKTPAVEKPVAEKPVASSVATGAGPKTAAAAANDLQARADAIAKQLAGKPAAIAAAKAEASKPEAKTPAAVAQTKPAPVKAAEAPKPATPAPAGKPAQPTKVAAAAKPADKNAVPALRMSANAY